MNLLTAQNTVEAELRALNSSAREAVYLSNFMMELGFKAFGSVPINSDSTRALTVASYAMPGSTYNKKRHSLFFCFSSDLRTAFTTNRASGCLRASRPRICLSKASRSSCN